MENNVSTNQGQTRIERVCPKRGSVFNRTQRTRPAYGWTVTQKKKVPHGIAIASILFCLTGFFFGGIIFGIIGAGLGSAARENGDSLGSIGFILGIIILMLALH